MDIIVMDMIFSCVLNNIAFVKMALYNIAFSNSTLNKTVFNNICIQHNCFWKGTSATLESHFLHSMLKHSYLFLELGWIIAGLP